MSYILEALKKAEAERRTGGAPSIHTPHSFAVPARRPVWRRPLPLLAAGAAALMLGGGIWLAGRPDPAPPPQLASASPPSASAPAAAPAEPAPTPPQAAETPPAKAKEAPPQEKPAKMPPVKKSPPKKEAPPSKANEAEPPAAASIPTLRQLPQEVQREIPSLEIGGYIYSGNKADRSVLINKRLLREGDEVAPDLTLERLLPNGMVMNFRGHRYRASY